MSDRFRSLLAEWKGLEREANDAQRALNEKFHAFLNGEGAEPPESERQQVERLRDRANSALEVAMAYVRTAAHGPISRK
ncbi:hypothetical protein [Ramlibacter sp. PS4R-6]|uniref:hypothetical protein n=1 Tax=Ramlibacter sp. PS4R-6 TaxID=3133438 RepID=UPI0030994D1D